MHLKQITLERAEEFLFKNFSSPTHWPDWNLIIQKFYNTNFFYLGVFTKDHLTGIYPVHSVASNKRLVNKWYSGHFKYMPNGGWIFSNPTHFNFNHLPKAFRRIHICYSLPEIPEFNVTYSGNSIKEAKTLIINLENSENDIWQNSINSKRRNMIKKALKCGIKISSISSINEVNDFYHVYLEASANNSLSILPINFFKEIMINGNNISLQILIAHKNGKHISNIAIMYDKNYGIYWLGNTNGKEMSNEGHGELLQWAAIQFLKSKGCKYYDLCYVDSEKLPNIHLFKRGFSNNEVTIKILYNKTFYHKVINRLVHDNVHVK